MVRSLADFITAIDCRFPYDDQSAAHALIDEACAISADAAYMVVHELARRPGSSTTPDETCLALLDRLDRQLVHPAKSAVVAVARRMIRRESVALDELTNVMRVISRHAGQFNALALVTFACEDDDVAAVKAIHDQVVEGWSRPN